MRGNVEATAYTPPRRLYPIFFPHKDAIGCALKGAIFCAFKVVKNCAFDWSVNCADKDAENEPILY
jgi:hypothetical protein